MAALDVYWTRNPYPAPLSDHPSYTTEKNMFSGTLGRCMLEVLGHFHIKSASLDHSITTVIEMKQGFCACQLLHVCHQG